MLRLPIGSVKVGARAFGEEVSKRVLTVGLTTAISKISAKPMQNLREDLTDTCAGTLLGYRRNCAQSSAASQVRRV